MLAVITARKDVDNNPDNDIWKVWKVDSPESMIRQHCRWLVDSGAYDYADYGWGVDLTWAYCPGAILPGFLATSDRFPTAT